MRYYSNVLGATGHTPLIQVSTVTEGLPILVRSWAGLQSAPPGV